MHLAGFGCYFAGECENGDLRLVGGTVPSRGRLEVCIDGLWGTVSDDGFARHEGAIACKQLGYYPNCEIYYLSLYLNACVVSLPQMLMCVQMHTMVREQELFTWMQ